MRDGSVRFASCIRTDGGEPIMPIDIEWTADEWEEIVASMGATLESFSMAVKLAAAHQLHRGHHSCPTDCK